MGGRDLRERGNECWVDEETVDENTADSNESDLRDLEVHFDL